MKQQAKKKTEPRRVVAAAFGTFLRAKRESEHWSQAAVAELVKDRVAVSGTFISHIEQGKVAAPDPVLLRELSILYRVPFDDLVDLLRRNRQAPNAVLEDLWSNTPEEADMVVRGEDEYFVQKFRQLKPTQRRDVLKFMDFEASRGAADSVEAPFRQARKKR